MPRKQRVSFIVSFVLPYGCSPGRAQEYVKDAVASMHREYGSEDPIYLLDGETVKVTKKRKEKI